MKEMSRGAIFHVIAITCNTKKEFETMKQQCVTVQCLFIYSLDGRDTVTGNRDASTQTLTGF